MQIILLGPPGSGKGTLAAELVEIYHLPHISTGDIFRQNIKAKTPLGMEAAQFINSGAIVPDSVTIAMVEDRLNQPDCNQGFMLDGFPRTQAQAEALTAILTRRNQPLTAVLNVCVSDETVLRRLSGRRVCSGCGRGYNLHSLPPQTEGICDACGKSLIQREDDKPDTIRQRLQTYYQQTEPLISYYQQMGLIFDVNNEGEVGASLNLVRAKLSACLAGE